MHDPHRNRWAQEAGAEVGGLFLAEKERVLLWNVWWDVKRIEVKAAIARKDSLIKTKDWTLEGDHQFEGGRMHH